MPDPTTPHTQAELREKIARAIAGAEYAEMGDRAAARADHMQRWYLKHADAALSVIAPLLEERDVADRRAGAAERHNEALKDEAIKRTDWLHRAKQAAGYDTNVSFDVVWTDMRNRALEAERRALAAEQALAERDARLAEAEEVMRNLRMVPAVRQVLGDKHTPDCDCPLCKVDAFLERGK